MGVYEMTIDTIFLCFCEDAEENNGADRPYFMSNGLMKVMRDLKGFVPVDSQFSSNQPQYIPGEGYPMMPQNQLYNPAAPGGYPLDQPSQYPSYNPMKTQSESLHPMMPQNPTYNSSGQPLEGYPAGPQQHYYPNPLDNQTAGAYPGYNQTHQSAYPPIPQHTYPHQLNAPYPTIPLSSDPTQAQAPYPVVLSSSDATLIQAPYPTVPQNFNFNQPQAPYLGIPQNPNSNQFPTPYPTMPQTPYNH
jgi:hypothetical protein